MFSDVKIPKTTYEIKMTDFEENFNENSEHFSDEDSLLMPVVTFATRKSKTRSKKPKVVSEWSDTEVFKLITCVHEHSVLWDARNIQYRNKHERTKLWDEMSENEFGSKFGGSELVAKWSNLRIQYRSYATKKRKFGQVKPPPIYWKFYSAMKFVEHADREQNASTESNLVSCVFEIVSM